MDNPVTPASSTPSQPSQPTTQTQSTPQASPPQPAQQNSTNSQQPTSPNPSPMPETNKPKVSFDFDPRTKLTVQWSAIWYGVGAIITNVAAQISYYFIGGIAGEIMRSFGGIFDTFSAEMLIKDVIWGVITGAIAGFILSKFYPQIQNINRKYLKNYLNTMFKLLFYPSLAGAVLGFLLSTTAAFATGIMPLIIIFAGVVVSSYVYAKMLSKKVEGQYPPPA